MNPNQPDKLRFAQPREFPQGAHRLAASSVLTLMLSAALAAICGCKKAPPPAPPPPVVQVMDIGGSNAPLHTETIGQLDSPQNIEIRARVEAFVEQMPFTEGVEVKMGQLLFQLDKRPFHERLAAANGMLAEAKAALKK